jgi:hypothetical protein
MHIQLCRVTAQKATLKETLKIIKIEAVNGIGHTSINICPALLTAFVSKKSSFAPLQHFLIVNSVISKYKLISACGGHDQLCHRHGVEGCWGFQNHQKINLSPFFCHVHEPMPCI